MHHQSVSLIRTLPHVDTDLCPRYDILANDLGLWPEPRAELELLPSSPNRTSLCHLYNAYRIFFRLLL
jgi:hypothetical protein